MPLTSLDPNAIAHARLGAFTGYACTQSAYCTPKTYERLRMAVANANHSARDAEWATRFYTHVAQLTGRDVELHDLEGKFCFRWQLVTTQGVASDPYFSRALESDVAASVASMLADVEATSRALPGLDINELGADGDKEATYARNTLYHRICNCLMHPGATQQALLAVVDTACKELCLEAAQRAQSRLHYQVTGILALQRLCAAVNNGTAEVSQQIDEEVEAIGYLVRCPPPVLTSELEQLNVPLGELRSYLFPAEPERMNGVILGDTVGRWAATYYDSVTTACINALTTLREIAKVRFDWSGYAGIALWHRTVNRDLINTALATGGFDAVTGFPKVAHTHAFTDQVLVATVTSQSTALRVTRLASVVVQAVRAGLLKPRTVRAEGILALVSRFGCEAAVNRDRVMQRGMGDEQMGVEMDTADAAPYHAMIVAAPVPVPAPAFVPTTQMTLVVTLHETARVQKCLQRDYVLLSIVRDCLVQAPFVMVPGPDTDEEGQPPVEERGYLGIGAVGDKTKHVPNLGEPVSPMLERFGKASLTMTLGHLMHKVADNVVQSHKNYHDGDVMYGDMPTWVTGTKGLSFSKAGRSHLIHYVSWVLQCMLPPHGPVFANTWHTSRSSKSHARRKQVPQAIGEGNLG